MTEVLILILLGLAGYFLYKALRKKKPKAEALPQRTDLANLTIKDAIRGDNIILSGASQSYEDLSFTVDRLNRYESDGEQWFELSGLGAGKRVFLEWSEDDELEITLQRQDGLHLEAIGVTEEDLAQMDEERSRSRFIEYQGKRWYYRESAEAGYFKDDGLEGEGFYYWKFDCDELQLFIEKYEGDPFEVGISEKISPGRVRIFRA
ncbi:MAG: DUF4178 domain-containing protein [Acidobacteria bacterium]|nr:DUF4178 domain-containing protein [Acidobacteriota bacterium]